MNRTEYIVVKAYADSTNFGNFLAEVQKHLNEGAQLQGGVAICPAGTKSFLVQALTKTIKEVLPDATTPSKTKGV